MNNELEDEQPLDPVMERVRRKMIRLQLVSVGIMLAGLLAVLFAIVFKVTNPAPSENASESVGLEHTLQLGSGEQVLSHTVSDNRLILELVNSDGAKRFVFVNIDNGSIAGTLNVEQ